MGASELYTTKDDQEAWDKTNEMNIDELYDKIFEIAEYMDLDADDTNIFEQLKKRFGRKFKPSNFDYRPVVLGYGVPKKDLVRAKL